MDGARNPLPAFITDALWWLWQQEATIPGAQFGGVYANKSGYHNTVNANRKSWPGNYSVRLPLDLTGPRDKARALDTTLGPAEMIRRTGYLKRAAEHPDDTRLYGLREFIGTLDGQRVFCMIRDTDSGPWQVDWSRDRSHLWHIHKSFWTAYCADVDAARAVASVMLGRTWQQWMEDEEMDAATFAKLLDDPAVKARMRALPWQYSGGGIDSDKSTLGVLNEVHQLAKRLATVETTVNQLLARPTVVVDKATLIEALSDPALLASLATAVNDDTARRLQA